MKISVTQFTGFRRVLLCHNPEFIVWANSGIVQILRDVTPARPYASHSRDSGKTK